jgi:hypothetical protein
VARRENAAATMTFFDIGRPLRARCEDRMASS